MWGCYLTGMWLYRLGLTRAKEYALTGKPLSGTEAVEAGLINAPVPFARLESEVRERAEQLAAIPLSQLSRDEADRQPGLREHGARLDAGARADSRRADAQHARCRAVHRAGRARGRRRAVALRDGPFGDYSQAPPEEQPDPNNVIVP